MVGGGGEELGGVVVVAGCGGGSGAGRGRGLLLLLLSRCHASNYSGSPPCWLELAYLARYCCTHRLKSPIMVPRTLSRAAQAPAKAASLGCFVRSAGWEYRRLLQAASHATECT